MTPLTYYTVIIGKRSSMVKYAQGPAYEVKLFPHPFADPGEAHQEFKKTLSGKFECLTNGVFDRKIDSLSSRYQQDLVNLQAWNQGKPALQAERTSPMALTNEQFFSALSPDGLELAEEYLLDDLAMLQENDLPVSDTVAGLLMVYGLQQEGQQDQEEDDL